MWNLPWKKIVTVCVLHNRLTCIWCPQKATVSVAACMCDCSTQRVFNCTCSEFRLLCHFCWSRSVAVWMCSKEFGKCNSIILPYYTTLNTKLKGVKWSTIASPNTFCVGYLVLERFSNLRPLKVSFGVVIVDSFLFASPGFSASPTTPQPQNSQGLNVDFDSFFGNNGNANNLDSTGKHTLLPP